MVSTERVAKEHEFRLLRNMHKKTVKYYFGIITEI